MRNIADAADVSVGLVSSVLSNLHVERGISLATVAKVKTAAARLGYLPNINARRLRRDTSARQAIVLALITSYEAPLNLVDHFVTGLRLLTGKKAGQPRDSAFLLMIDMFFAGRLREMPGFLSGDHFNAAIIMNTTQKDDEFLASSVLPYPAVLVNRRIAGYSGVMEAVDGGNRAAKVLVRAGRRRLVVLHGSPLTQNTEIRVNGFLHNASELTGGPPVELVASRLSEDAADKAMTKFLNGGGEPDGVYAVTDGMALGAYRAMKRKGLQIPKDVAVVGVGDYDMSRFFDPSLSCVGAPHKKLGSESIRLLLELIRNPGSNPTRLEIKVVEELRESTGHATKN